MPDNRNTAEATASSPQVKVTGNPDIWHLLCKASLPGKWMKSTKAMMVPPGIALQVSTELTTNITLKGETVTISVPAEAVTFVPDVALAPDITEDGKTITWKIVGS